MDAKRRRFLQMGLGLSAVAASTAYAIGAPRRRRIRDPGYEDLAVPDDISLGHVALSPNGDRIALESYDCTSTRLYVASYPPKRQSDYVKVADVPNAIYGVRSMAWCRERPEKLAFIVQQPRAHNFPRITSRAEFLKAEAAAKLGDKDYQFVVYTVNADGTGLKNVCPLIGGPINGRSKEGSTIALAWPFRTKLYYYMEGKITRIDLPRAGTRLFFEQAAGKMVRELFLDDDRIATLEFAGIRAGLELVFLDDGGKVVRRAPLADFGDARETLYPLYQGGSVYVDICREDQTVLIKVLRLSDLRPVGWFPRVSDGWSHSPTAIARGGDEVICRAVKRDSGNVGPEPGKSIATSDLLDDGGRSATLLNKLVCVTPKPT